MASTLIFLAFIIAGYLVGSVCSAVIVSQLFALPDPRIEGSLNPGATNVLRLAGKKYAALVLLFDVFKGLLPVLLAIALGAGIIVASFAGLAAVIGHIYPIFFKFKGGKGVATALGVLFGLNFLLGTFATATWILVANFSRYSSLASIVTIIFAPFYSIYALGSVNAFIPLASITFIVLYKHRTNINRLLNGTESKLNFRKKKISEQSKAKEHQENLEHPHPIDTFTDIITSDNNNTEKEKDKEKNKTRKRT